MIGGYKSVPTAIDQFPAQTASKIDLLQNTIVRDYVHCTRSKLSTFNGYGVLVVSGVERKRSAMTSPSRLF